MVARLVGPSIHPDDLVQEVFVVALRREHQFAEGPPPAWLFGVAARVAAAARRRARLREWVGLEPGHEPPDGATPESAFEQAEAAQEIYAVLDELSEVKRTVFILHEIEGRGGEEIAAILGCPAKTVWTRLGRARQEFTARMRRRRAQQQGGPSHG